VSGDPDLAGDAATVRERFEAAGILLGSYDGPDLVVVAANAALRAILGRSDIVGRALGEAVPEFAGQQILAMGRRVFTTGEPQAGREWQFVVDRDGGPQEMFADFVLEPYRGADGGIVGVTAYATDVTEQVLRRRTEQARTAEVVRRYERARDVITALQEELLPTALPVLPGAQLGGTYLLADEDGAAGGDWFDALALPGGRVGLVVGDVVGHGVAASAVMSQLRAVLAERLGAGAGIAAALSALDRFAARIPAARAATVCVAVLDPADGSVEYCTAGHPPPLVASAVDETRFLAASGARPLGVGGHFDGAVLGTTHLDDGDVLLLYTDGILERPGRELQAGTVEMLAVADDALAGRVAVGRSMIAVDRVALLTLELLVRETGHTDDTTLLAVQRVAAVEPLRVVLPAHAGSLAAARAELTVWLDLHEVGLTTQTDVQHAVGELLTNVVDHAYRDREASGPDGPTATLTVELTADGEIRAEVADHGGWREPPEAEPGSDLTRGAGLAMVSDLMDSVRLDATSSGTTVVVHRRAERPAHVLTAERLSSGGTPSRPRTARRTGLHVRETANAAGRRIRVEGPIDGETADRLHRELQRRTHGGVDPVHVDLAGVTLLSSAGVAVLHDFTDPARPAPARLVAPPQSPAGQILTLVGLAHSTGDAGPDPWDEA
jgi:serine phosphatase RsbU (regulator of sigma subunit)/anti-sigma regulatory factor (Ser/Thr protein kinase)/anti-anti-sigma regulatory factor